MAFKIKLSNKELTNSEANRIYLTDITGNVGDINYVQNDNNITIYDSVVNSTGYGESNPDRNSLANFIVGRLKKMSGVDKPIEFLPYNPLTVSEYVAKVTEDGWYVFNIISLPLVSSTVEGKAWWDSTNGGVYQFNSGEAEEVTLISLLSTIYNSEQVEQFFVGNTKLLKSKYNLKITELLRTNINCCHEKQLSRLSDSYNELRGVLQSAIYEYCRGNKYNAQENIEFLNNQIDELL